VEQRSDVRCEDLIWVRRGRPGFDLGDSLAGEHRRQPQRVFVALVAGGAGIIRSGASAPTVSGPQFHPAVVVIVTPLVVVRIPNRRNVSYAFRVNDG
jgi:hypothetical protein